MYGSSAYEDDAAVMMCMFCLKGVDGISMCFCRDGIGYDIVVALYL